MAAINVTTDAEDTDNKTKKERISRLIQKGQQISRLLGYQGPYPQFLS